MLDIILWIILIVVVVLILAAILMFNGLVLLRNRVDNAWAQIDVQLKKRYDLVPNLVETVKGYAKQEKTVFEEVTKERAAIMKANNVLPGPLKSLFPVAEAYPQLQSSQNFMMLQEELSGIEGKIAFSRQFYNDSVLTYDTAIQQLPGSIVAGIFGFKEKPYFEIEEKSREAV